MNIKQSIRLSVDAVVFGYQRDRGVSVLLIQRKIEPFQGDWALPGGFVLDEESLEQAVARELQEEAGIDVGYLEQLYTFGQPMRDPRMRVVSVTYFALVQPDSFELHASTDAADAQWFSIDEVPELAFDHRQILDAAITRLRGKVLYEPIGFELLDDKFPFSELEKLYTTLLNRDIDRRNFKRKIMSYGILEELDEKVKSKGAGRPGNLFRFNKKKYFELKEKGIAFEI